MEEKKEEKLEFLKREEIRTMQKDIAKLREIEAQKERERVAGLKLEEKPKVPPSPAMAEKATEAPAPPPPSVSTIEKTPLETLIPKPKVRKPTLEKKILIRGLIILIFLLLIGFLYWFFGVRGRPLTEEEVIPPAKEIIPPEKEVIEEVVEKPAIIIPPALISVEATETLEISVSGEIPELLGQVLKKNLGENQFTRILITNTKENKILGLKDFFEVFGVKTPDNFYDRLNNDFTLFIYSSRNINRLGFITEIVEKENFVDLLNVWEKTMEKDFEKLLLTLGKEGPAARSAFSSASYRGRTFRYLSMPPENFGLVWAISGDYFLLTFSGESMIKTIDKLTQ